MVMKPIKLLAPLGFGFKQSLTFKFEWRLDYELQFPRGKWLKKHKFFESRAKLRAYKRYHTDSNHRNFKISRRLVQTVWEPYNDSFGWNVGNGKR
jgi:hypothetical protein